MIDKSTHHGVYRIVFLSVVVLLLATTVGYRRIIYNIANVQLVSSLMQGRVIQPSNASLYLQGVVAYKQQQYSQAVALLRKARFADRTLVRWYLAQAENKRGNWRAALRSLDLQVPAERKLYAGILFEHLPTLTVQEQEQWQQRIQQEYPDMIVLYAAHLFSTQQFAQAEVWAKLTPDYAQSGEAQVIVGKSYFYRGESAEAERVFEAAYMQFPGVITAYWYGRILDYNGKPQLAIPLLEEAATKGQGSTASWYLRELAVAYAHVGRCADANAAFDRALQSDKSTANAERIAAARAALPVVCKTQR